MAAGEFALANGTGETRAALARWRADRWTVLRSWALASLAVTGLLLTAVWAAATASVPDPTGLVLPGVTREARAADLGPIFLGNGLVLTLHALSCVAGYIAGSSLPRATERQTGLSRRVHELAGPFAMLFVAGATLFSLATQAFVLGGFASTLSAQLGLTPLQLVASLLPHALPELVALFLPLAAWTLAGRRGRWEELLAATLVTVALAVPLLVASALVELWVSPELIRAIAS